MAALASSVQASTNDVIHDDAMLGEVALQLWILLHISCLCCFE